MVNHHFSVCSDFVIILFVVLHYLKHFVRFSLHCVRFWYRNCRKIEGTMSGAGLRQSIQGEDEAWMLNNLHRRCRHRCCREISPLMLLWEQSNWTAVFSKLDYGEYSMFKNSNSSQKIIFYAEQVSQFS